MKIIALDVGTKRIGVATADTSIRIAVAHSTLLVDDDVFAEIAKICRLEKTGLIVVGLPRNSQGQETLQSQVVRNFVTALKQYFVANKLEKPLVKFLDESLSSVLAEENLARKKKPSRDKGEIDKEAATIILQDFLDSFRPEDYNSQPKTKKDNLMSQPKKNKKSNKFFKILTFFIAILILAFTASIVYYHYLLSPILTQQDCEKPSASKLCSPSQFKIQRGESTEVIANQLEEAGFIRSAFAFKVYLKISSPNTKLKAGSYTIRGTQSIAEILHSLSSDPLAETFRITFLPGETLRGVKARLLAIGYDEELIDAALKKNYQHPLLATKPASASLEGYVYGETYEFYKSATVEDILTRTFEEFYKVINKHDLLKSFSQQELNLHEAITLASVIQREAYPKDQAQVAQVFLSRLKKGIVLGSDAIIGYAADQIDPSRAKTDMSYLNTITCPWNSRRCQGLPPTPIAVPSLSALSALAHPATGDYLYFLTGDDSKMYYARTESEHQQNIKKHCKAMCAIL